MAKSKKTKNQMGRAIAGCLINVLVFPGLGSIIGGKTGTGAVQMILILVGFITMWFLIGIPILLLTWLWALITGINMIQDAE